MTKSKWLDLAERAGWTFLQAFLAVWLAPIAADILGGGQTLSTIWQSLSDLSILDKAAVGGLAGVISLAKSVGLGGLIGNPESVSTLPVEYDPATPEIARKP